MAKKKNLNQTTKKVIPDEEEHFETFEEAQARIRAGNGNVTPRPDHQNSFGHPFYQGSPDVNPDNALLEFGEADPNRENR